MSRSIILAFALTLASVPAIEVSAQTSSDFAAVLGAWEMTLDTPRGSMTQTLTFVADGDELTGSATARNGTIQLQNVAFEDGRITFQVTRTLRNREITQSYSATIQGDQMTGTVSGGRGGGREFTAVRSST
ncbi:MAG: hypothetical protein F4179_04385 [Gammaproteobacteria bacterium]|nr:hypothetical protein [Gammaproteobacteria bacterium]MYD00053.1 hypothetical protein [Gammaproteobacteria bacterium]MYF60901.1 hypothetical protein [Gammaproteobacteria bacterium]MYI21596.1 hypothetical protein [Gammaproteobacteria bacterium]